MQLRSVIAVAGSLALLFFSSLLAAQQTTPHATSADDSLDATNSPTEDADSNVRIVRLSEVTGTVAIDRDVGDGFEDALVNMPITERTMLKTGLGFAEVEFEDNSTLRLTPNSLVEFQRLELLPSGAKVSTINVERGTVFVSLSRSPGQEFKLTFGHQETSLAPATNLRLFLSGTWATLAVFGGSVQLDTPAGPLFVSKKKTLTLELLSPPQITVSKNVEAPYDEWNQQAIEYHEHFAKGKAFANTVNTSGVSDMNRYGRLVNTGCGPLWRPYFATAVWDPFANGAWVWYPAWGYAWVSPYPWGWMPYHYGSWEYCPGYGWGWRRSGTKFRPIPKPVKPPHGIPPGPRPPRHPEPGAPRIIPVNQKPAVASGLNSASRLVIRQDSAGLGVPRSTTGNLNRLAEHLGQRGTESMAVRSPVATAESRAAFSSGYPAQSGRTSYSHTGASSYSSARSSSYSGATGHSYSSSDSGRGSTSTGSAVGGGGGRK